jgi:hypothetical protein
MMTQRSTVKIDQIPGNHDFQRFILAVQADLIDIGALFQQPGQTEFPEVPFGGGMFRTRKGVYEGVFTDPVNTGDPELPRWRRLSNGTLYESGDTIPTTL